MSTKEIGLALVVIGMLVLIFGPERTRNPGDVLAFVGLLAILCGSGRKWR